MRVRRKFTRTSLWAVAVTMAALGPVPSATGVSDGNPDDFDAVSLLAPPGATSEVPYVGPTHTFESGVFDTSGFSWGPGEGDGTAPPAQCVLPGPTAVYAGRTAWHRFDPGVSGRIEVTATTAFDAVLAVRPARQVSWRSATFADLVAPVTCVDSVPGAGAEVVSDVRVAADRVYFVQVGSRCAGGPSTCSEPTVTGGAASVSLVFVPDDGDGDGVPDAVDNCEGAGTPGGVTANGCPDADLDGIADTDDDCPGVAGVPSPAPFNGCPPGPQLQPSNNPFVRIQSLSGNTEVTASRRVEIRLTWPEGTTTAVISNPKGRTTTRTVEKPRRRVRWELRQATRPTGRWVRVRFSGPRVARVSVGDDIRVDPIDPEVQEALLIPTESGWYVGVQLTDVGSGVSTAEVLDQDQQPIDELAEICTSETCAPEVDEMFVTPDQVPQFVRVTDAAGNDPVVPLARSAMATGCPPAYPVPRLKNIWKPMCMSLGENCTEEKDLLNWKYSEVRCRRPQGGTLRVRPAGSS